MGFFIQASYTNWSGGKDDSVKEVDGKILIEYVINHIKTIIKKINYNSIIIIVAPDSKENREYFSNLASKFNIDVFWGSKENVLTRFIACSKNFGITHCVRINGSFWYFDDDLFFLMFDKFMRGTHDIVRLPHSYPKGFAADFVTVDALTRLEKISALKGMMPVTSPITEFDAFNQEFSVLEFCDVPRYSEDYIQHIRKSRLQYEPERVEFDPSKVVLAGSIDHKRYCKALEYITSRDHVLDIATGEGFGASILATKCASVVGADYNVQIIDYCRKHYSQKNLSFEVQDVTKMTIKDRTFNVVTSMETIEHVNKNLFVHEVSRVLKPNGMLILSTPQNPWGFTLVPWHVKEYGLTEIKEVLGTHFTILKIHGIASHDILENSEEGDRMLVIARKTAQ